MSLNWRIWLLGFFISASIVSILAASGAARLVVFVLILGVFFALHFINSKKIAIFVSIFLVALAVLIAFTSYSSGVIVKSIDKNSIEFKEGIKVGDIIREINSIPIKSYEDYTIAVSEIFNGEKEKKVEIVTDKGDYTFFTNKTLEMTVSDISRTKIQTGLDLRGGARALVQPDVVIDDIQLDELVQVASNRFNVYGIADVQIKGVKDAENNKFMLIEVAGATPSDLEELISQQGKFEAKVSNLTVFQGGNKDIANVCRNDATCAGIRQCTPSAGEYICNFQFTISLNQEAAERHAAITGNLSLDDTGQYLSEKLYLYIDDNEVDSLLIGADLKGQVTTQISIQGSGKGNTQEAAYNDAKASMNKLQTILITGSLPYKLNIVKLDSISSVLGNDFTHLLLGAGIGALILVSIIIFIRYRKLKISLALLFTSFSEIIIILGFASLIKWNLDLPSIAGILATIGTGVDSQIVILDEAERHKTVSVKERIQRALFIILSVYATALASLIPLYWAGAGLFKGFAITSIIGITAGVFIARPAFAEIIKKMKE